MAKNEPIGMFPYRESVRLNATTYEDWLSENPKTVVGGPIDIETDNYGTKFFISRKMITKILPDHYAKKLFIYCSYNFYKGLKIRVTPENFDYLLRADPTHEMGNFRTEDGSEYGNWPHFHELNFFKPLDDNTPGTRRIVTSGLYLGMPPNAFLDEFKFCYNIKDGAEEQTQAPITGSRQRGLTEDYGK